MGYVNQEAVEKSIQKIENKETITSENDCIPMITDDLAKLLSACPSGYLSIEIEEDEDNHSFEIKSIIPAHMLTHIVLKREVPIMDEYGDMQKENKELKERVTFLEKELLNYMEQLVWGTSDNVEKDIESECQRLFGKSREEMHDKYLRLVS